MSPSTLLLVRHGQSLGNVAADAAHSSGAEVVPVPARDPDVELSALGEAQARALGAWLAAQPVAERPATVWASPYVRAHRTAEIALRSAGLDLRVRLDERLRDRELGVLDTLTGRGVDAQQPFEAQRRRWLGKFYYRPPGGESWADIALRLRAFLTDLDVLRAAGAVGEGPVMVVCHDAPIMVLRYLCEELTESEILAVGRERSLRNTSVTRLVRDGGPGTVWTMRDFDAADHLAELDVPATAPPGTTDGAL
ncbi:MULTISPECIES: histidine phosphatase family protein [unclassified Actinotalea]|uniref:histidine phosphatase family protein n=1 Tax=unclassified Actinotalea TaxID=2638618 RepID=UPI0015F5BA8F|nr:MULTISPECIES: histidine phosphatase family protein [unclassified Actinotalea]